MSFNVFRNTNNNRRYNNGGPNNQNRGDRYRNEHDDRGGNSDGMRNNRNNYGGGGGYRGNDRNRRLPDGHWRGGDNKERRGGGGGGYRGQRNNNNRQGFRDADGGGGRGNRREGLYKGRGRRNKNRDRPNIYHNDNKSAGWYKIIIKDSGGHDKDEVMGAIRRVIQHEFIPIMYEPEGNNRVFYIEDNGPAAQAILDISRRVSISTGQKLVIITTRTAPPARALTPEQREAITVVMSGRYSVELKRLDMKNFHNDPNLLKAEIFCPINRLNNMKEVVEIIMKHIPLVEEIDFTSNKLFSLEGLKPLMNACPNLKRLSFASNKLANIDTLKFLDGLNIIDLTLEGNGLCNKFRETEKYISTVRSHFPKVMYLDGQELPKPIGFEIDDEEVSKLPPNMMSYFAHPEVRDIVLKFIEQYYQIYDSEERQPLAAAYTEDAVFSLACAFPDSGPASRLTSLYNLQNRNLKKDPSSEKKEETLFRGRDNIISILRKLPMTTHDPNSFTVDVPVAESNLIHVTLNGVFRQLTDRTPLVRSFTRNFIVVPQGGGYCICNEKLFLTSATVEQIKKSYKAIAQTTPIQPAIAPPVVPPVVASAAIEGQALIAAQEDMIIKFCEASGMLPNYSRMCLEKNEWDFAKAGEMFTELKAENKIPPEYFVQST